MKPSRAASPKPSLGSYRRQLEKLLKQIISEKQGTATPEIKSQRKVRAR